MCSVVSGLDGFGAVHFVVFIVDMKSRCDSSTVRFFVVFLHSGHICVSLEFSGRCVLWSLFMCLVIVVLVLYILLQLFILHFQLCCWCGSMYSSFFQISGSVRWSGIFSSRILFCGVFCGFYSLFFCAIFSGGCLGDRLGFVLLEWCSWYVVLSMFLHLLCGLVLAGIGMCSILVASFLGLGVLVLSLGFRIVFDKMDIW